MALVWAIFLSPAGPHAVAFAMPVEEAGQHVGRSVSIEGFIEKVVCSPRACLLSFDAGWSGLVATIAAADVDRFPDPRTSYERQTVRLRGVVEDREGRLRVDLVDPSKIEVVGGTARRARSEVLSAEEKPPVRTDDSRPRGRSQVEVSGGLSPRTGRAGLGNVVREMEEQAATGGGGSPSLAVRGLRERVAIQSQTIRTLESELIEMNGRLQELEERPAPVEEEASLEGVPQIERWVVPARRGFKEPRPRTGWSVDRLVREVGWPQEVSELSHGHALWVYDRGRAVTVARGRVVSASGF